VGDGILRSGLSGGLHLHAAIDAHADVKARNEHQGQYWRDEAKLNGGDAPGAIVWLKEKATERSTPVCEACGGRNDGLQSK
jgi:hypothetical protein